MTSVVRPRMSRAIAAWTRRSDSESSALVASSRSRIGASLRKARASAMRWRSPPERRSPPWPTARRSPRGGAAMKSCAAAAFAAATISSLARARPAEGDVRPHRVVEQHHVLADDRDLGAQRAPASRRARPGRRSGRRRRSRRRGAARARAASTCRSPSGRRAPWSSPPARRSRCRRAPATSSR